MEDKFFFTRVINLEGTETRNMVHSPDCLKSLPREVIKKKGKKKTIRNTYWIFLTKDFISDITSENLFLIPCIKFSY